MTDYLHSQYVRGDFCPNIGERGFFIEKKLGLVGGGGMGGDSGESHGPPGFILLVNTYF